MRYFLLPLLALGACARQGETETPAPAAATSALYRVTFEGQWRPDTHANYPAGAHFSPLVGTAHRAGSGLFAAGQPASTGIKDMAERGNNTALRAEIDALAASGAAGRFFGANTQGKTIGASSSLADTVRLDQQHPQLSIVTMIAPSPDWFVALENESLFADGQWAAQRTVPARAYDAGTDSGASFTAPDQPTTPATPIQQLLVPPYSGTAPDGPPLGQWRIERVK